VLAEQAHARDGEIRDAQIVVDDLSDEQGKVDADVEQVKARRKRDRDRMDQGLITNPKDLQRMQGELESLERRISSLEDQELEVMEKLEEAQATLDSLTAQEHAARERIEVLTTSRDEKLEAIDVELREVAADRKPVADALPQDLLALYDRLRASKNGVGAAAIRARECSGCRLAIDAAELGTIRAAAEDEVLRCEECQRILVRTPESGL
jgi:predicted  nucleic acid-binding Zn-ribbon protein